MNSIDQKKLRLISLLIDENNEDLLNKIEKILLVSSALPVARFGNFSNKLSVEELDEFEKNINEGCGKSVTI